MNINNAHCKECLEILAMKMHIYNTKREIGGDLITGTYLGVAVTAEGILTILNMRDSIGNAL